MIFKIIGLSRSPYDLKENGHNCNYEENVDHSTCGIHKKAQQPADNEYNSNNIK
jgi:hypothetical protein